MPYSTQSLAPSAPSNLLAGLVLTAAPPLPMGGKCSTPQEHTFEVIVNVYNLLPSGVGSTVLNIISGSGVYHTGIEIDGVEYAYGGSAASHENGFTQAQLQQTGVWTQQPKVLPRASFQGASLKTSLIMGTVTVTRAELRGVLKQLKQEWRAVRYDLLTRNCNHFTAAACEALGVPPPPSWINRIATGGASLMAAFGSALALAPSPPAR